MEFKIEYSPIVRTYLYKSKDNEVLGVEYHRDNQYTINVKVDDRLVVATLPNGIKGKAKCSPEDEFDLSKGVAIAVKRAYQNEIEKDIKKLIK